MIRGSGTAEHGLHRSSLYLGRHPSEQYYLVLKSSVRRLVSTLDVRFAEPLQQHGF